MCPNCLKNQRELATLRRKLWVIQEVSRVKNDLINLDASANFRKTVVNGKYRHQLEAISYAEFVVREFNTTHFLMIPLI